MTSAIAAFGIAVGATSAICYALMTRTGRGATGGAAGSDGGLYGGWNLTSWSGSDGGATGSSFDSGTGASCDSGGGDGGSCDAGGGGGGGGD